MDLQGNIIDVYDIAPPNTLGTISSLKFITNSTISATAVWGPWGGSGYDIDNYAVILDTLGNIIEQEVVIQSISPMITEVTYDKKILEFVETISEDGAFDVYLFKLNQQLQGDSVYTRWFNYDSLCPYQIVSDTIPIEGCGLIVGMEELYDGNNNKEPELLIYPNPAQAQFTIQCEAFNESPTKVEIFDLYGQSIKTLEIPKGQTETTVTTEGWQKGVYLIQVWRSGSFIASGKVVMW